MKLTLWKALWKMWRKLRTDCSWSPFSLSFEKLIASLHASHLTLQMMLRRIYSRRSQKTPPRKRYRHPQSCRKPQSITFREELLLILDSTNLTKLTLTCLKADMTSICSQMGMTALLKRNIWSHLVWVTLVDLTITADQFLEHSSFVSLCFWPQPHSHSLSSPMRCSETIRGFCSGSNAVSFPYVWSPLPSEELFEETFFHV